MFPITPLHHHTKQRNSHNTHTHIFTHTLTQHTHTITHTQYALLAQNLADDATSTFEALWAMASGQDLLAATLFYAACLTALAFCCWAGLGWGILVAVCYLLRPPFLRGVPGVWGFRAFFSNLPARSAEDFV